MAADLSQLHPFLPPPSPCPALSSPPSSDALTSSDDDDDYLAQLTRLMANHMLLEQSHDTRLNNPVYLPAAEFASRDMPRWADLFADSPRSTLWPSSGSSPKGYPGRGARPAYEPGIEENTDKITKVPCRDRNANLVPVLSSNQTLPRDDDANWTKEDKTSENRPERSLRQGNSGKGRRKKNQWKTRRGEGYLGLCLPHQQEEKREVITGDGKWRRNEKVVGGSTGTGVFLPKTVQTEQGRKQQPSK